MAHGQEPDAYDYLATSKVSELTVAQLEQALENSYLNKTNIDFWQGPVLMHKLLEVSRTYPGAGMPIPESGAVGITEPIEASSTGFIQPPGTELWQITGMEGTGQLGTAVINLMWFDGSASVTMVTGKSLTTGGTMMDINEKVSAPFILSNSLYLAIAETSGNYACIIKYAYHKVSL